jgi:TolB-like protein
MRNRFCRDFALLLALTSFCLSNAFAAVGPRAQYTLAVLPLEASGRINADEANRLTERLAMELEKTGAFIITPLSTIAATLANGGAGCSSLECGVQAGKQLSTQLVVNGSVRKVGQLYFVEAQMIHVNSGQVVQRASEDFDGDFASLQNRMPAVARKLVGKSAAPNSAAAAPSSQEMTATEHGDAGVSGQADAPSNTSNTTEYRNGGGNKILIYGLVAVGAAGAAIGITQLTKGSDDKNDTKPPVTGGNLPNPPSFP